MTWFYVTAGDKAGPVDDATLEAMAANGTITPDTLVWKEGMTDWQPYRQVKPATLGMAAAGAAGAGDAPPVYGAQVVCTECGRLFPADETITYGHLRVCATCKPIFMQKLGEGLNVAAAGALVYASFWIRLAAFFLDALILWVVNTSVGFVFGLGISGLAGSSSGGSGAGVLPLAMLGILWVINIGIALSYETFFLGKFGATPGKMACKIKVVMPDGSPLTYWRAFGRYFAKLLSNFTCLIGFIIAAFDEERRTLHDRICDTRVVMK